MEIDYLKNPLIKEGDVVTLGRHTLVCGDCLDEDIIKKISEARQFNVTFTDPPYAIYGNSTGMKEDAGDISMVKPFVRDVVKLLLNSTESFGHIYIFCDWRTYPLWAEEMRNTKTPIKNLLVWVKNKGNGGLGSNYTFQHELIVFAHNIPHRNKVMMKGRKAGIKTVRGKGNVWYFNKINKAMSLKLHNAEKPVDLICYALENSTEENASVFDPFAGSGSTLIACEKTNRTFYGIEKDPYYCDIIVSRYIAATGDKRVVVSGREYSHFLGKRQE